MCNSYLCIFWNESHPHGCVSWNHSGCGHSVYDESHPHGCVSWNGKTCALSCRFWCHTLTGVWVEIKGDYNMPYINQKSHPHGCVSWNSQRGLADFGDGNVTPSRVCELKSEQIKDILSDPISHTLTGVWVEIQSLLRSSKASLVTPSRVCELKSE